MSTASSWLTRTGQTWKVVVFGALFVLAGCCLLLSSVDNETLWSLTGVGLGALSLGWFGLSIECPACNTRVGWWYVSRSSVLSWWPRFFYAERCPHCGDKG